MKFRLYFYKERKTFDIWEKIPKFYNLVVKKKLANASFYNYV